jgi:hypothetical protein
MQVASVRGRANPEYQATAISRVVALWQRAPALRAALDRVTASVAFQPSRRSQEFLRYVVDRELGDLKERKYRLQPCSTDRRTTTQLPMRWLG